MRALFVLALTSCLGLAACSSSSAPASGDDASADADDGADALAITPSTLSIAPRGKAQFSASGGSGGGYVFSLATNASGGSITPDGAYVAGTTGDVVDVVALVDSAGNQATANVQLNPPLHVVPDATTAPPRGIVEFSAFGGTGASFVWSLTKAPSGGTIDAMTGVYFAGATGNVTDEVHVVDPFGNEASTTVAIGAPISVSPPTATIAPLGTQTFTATGGANMGYVFTLTRDDSGGTIDGSSGAYVAGAMKGTDVVTATDGLGNTGTATITVGP